ncbi:hypothetical protein [Acetobacter sp. P1H12_c]|nr:hypothetical protein [Acetobacter sp. P1H12_c]
MKTPDQEGNNLPSARYTLGFNPAKTTKAAGVRAPGGFLTNA